jgi:hypothetical protein
VPVRKSATTDLFFGPFPAVEATDVIAMKAHTAEFHWHRLAFECECNMTSRDPPCRVRQYVVNRARPFVVDYSRQDLTLLSGQRSNECISRFSARRVELNALFDNQRLVDAVAGFTYKLVDYRFVRVNGTRALSVFEHIGTLHGSRRT